MALPLSPATCLYFGTFNPVHAGHLMIAQAVLNQFAGSLGLQSVTFIPANNPPHRDSESDLLPARHRAKMVALAIADNPRFRLSDVELQRPGKSYTVETLEHLLAQGLVQRPVPMIIGSDALAGLPGWHRPRDLVETVRFLQAPRPGYDFVSDVTIDGERLALKTFPVDMPMLSLSSTWIRAVLRDAGAEGDPLRYFLPEEVRRYIRANRLFADPASGHGA